MLQNSTQTSRSRRTALLLAWRGSVLPWPQYALAVQFWNTVAASMPDWQAAYDEKNLPADYRREFVCAHGIALAGLARLGRTLLSDFAKSWPTKLRKLLTVNWRRSNTAIWEGRAMIAGRLSKASTCVVLTGNVLKQTLGVPLSEHENQVEAALRTLK